MTYDEMIQSLLALNKEQNVGLNVVPHCSNLLHQLYKKDASKKAAYNEIYERYIKTRQVAFSGDNIKRYLEETLEEINRYMDYYWPPANNPFSHQTDFTSSIIPEMLCIILSRIVEPLDCSLEVSAQKDLAIECVFDIIGGGSINLKNKRVDVAVVKQCTLVFNGVSKELPIPLLAIECKTNLDKNMLSGIEQSVNDLKKTFPNCCYLVVTELSDFDIGKTNYASSGIDEIYVLRQQKRSAVRINPDARNLLNTSLVDEIVSRLKNNIELMNAVATDLSSRMENGKLIRRTV